MPTTISENRRGRGRPSLDEVLGLLDEEVALLKGSLGGLPRAVEADEILRAIWLDDVHNSTAIEGNTMTRAQVEALVERGRAASAALLENLEVRGYADAADWAYRNAPNYDRVPVTLVSELHKLAVKLAWDLEPPATRDLTRGVAEDAGAGACGQGFNAGGNPSRSRLLEQVHRQTRRETSRRACSGSPRMV